ncbi:MAG TPA: hypothetical protein VEH27_03940 [Methylomirabilota bacterium]|nr:hypothetical protein [Methylomirabilota bacterium]
MNYLILTEENLTTLNNLNTTGDPLRRCEPITLTDGRSALNADLLNDCGPGQTWAHYGSFLQTLPVETVS